MGYNPSSWKNTERNRMNEITFTLYCTTSEEAITEVKKLKEAHPKDRLQFNVNIKDDLYN